MPTGNIFISGVVETPTYCPSCLLGMARVVTPDQPTPPSVSYDRSNPLEGRYLIILANP